jgi:hypothetical protein
METAGQRPEGVQLPARLPPLYGGSALPKSSSQKLAYMREYCAAHRDEHRARSRAYYLADTERNRLKCATYYAAHREAARADCKARYIQNRADRLAYGKRYRAQHPEYRAQQAAYLVSWRAAHPEKHQFYDQRRRDLPWEWVRLDPWPTHCHACGLLIDPARRFPDPGSESVGHEPPIAWTKTHPEYAGSLILRPEHWGCNHAKGARPDWEM